MRTYADTSFIVDLLAQGLQSAEAVAEFRRLNRPPLFLLPLHRLEVENALRQRAFHQRRSLPSSERGAITRELTTALNRLEKFIDRGTFVEVSVDLEETITRARQLSERHTERLGCRGYDLLHVAAALELECELFLTEDRLQGEVAKAERLRVSTLIEL